MHAVKYSWAMVDAVQRPLIVRQRGRHKPVKHCRMVGFASTALAVALALSSTAITIAQECNEDVRAESLSVTAAPRRAGTDVQTCGRACTAVVVVHVRVAVACSSADTPCTRVTCVMYFLRICARLCVCVRACALACVPVRVTLGRCL
jgi:hypothetical protein